MGQAFLFTAIFCYYFVFNGIVASERDLTQILMPNSQIIQAQSDNRRGNVFYSTPEFYLSLKNVMPTLSTLLETEAMINYQIKEQDAFKPLRRKINVILTDENFFRSVQGKLVSGQVFSAQDVQAGRPIAVITSGLAQDLFGDSEHSPSLSINGRDFFVSGVWALKSKDIKENFTLILPISAINILGLTEKTYINKFILRGKGSRDLDHLKHAIDKIQLDSGFTPIRPEFSIIELKASQRYQNILSNQKVYWDVFIWILSLFTLIRLYLDFSKRFYDHGEWLQFRRMAGQSTEQAIRELQWETLKGLALVVLLAAVLSAVILLFLAFIFKVNIALGTSFHFALVLQIAGYALMFFQTHRKVGENSRQFSMSDGN